MKKMILLLILQLTASMAIDFTMTKEGLFVESTATIQPPTPGTAPGETNPYLEPVNLPKCDANNPEVQFIRNTTDWSTINSSKRIFCVSPGDYRSLKSIKLTASGTDEKRRYIILNNGNDLHPGKLDKNQLANFSLQFSGASYWTVDRASWFDTNYVGNAYHFRSESTNNILNRAFTDEVICSVEIRENAHNNTIQNSRFENMTDGARRADEVVIRLYEYGVDTFSIKNTKIINNEIKNSGDGIQTVISGADGEEQIANGEGTIIDSNHIYINSEIYTDGSGNYDPNGIRAYAENAIDLKFGSANASNPMIITNNIMWGYRQSDRTDAYCDDPGHAVVVHYGIKNVKFNDNVIFDSNSGFLSGDSGGFAYALSKSEFKNNLIYDSGAISGSSSYSLGMFSSNDIDVQNNTIIGARSALARFSYNGSGMNVTNNIKVNCSVDMSASNNSGGTYDDFIQGTGYTEDYVFTTDKFTNNPRPITLENVLKSTQ